MNMVNRAVGLLFRPGAAWAEIAEEKGGLLEVFVPYTLALVLMSNFFSGILQMLVLSIYPTGSEAAMRIFLVGTAASLLFWGIVVIVGGKVLELMAPGLQAKQDWVLSCRLIAYGFTPYFVTGLLGFIPMLGLLIQLIGFGWSLLLIYHGFSRLLKPAAMPILTPAEVPQR